MHYHLEVIMPPTEDIQGALDKILDPFSENNEEARHSFWDWWQVGGRYSGSKIEAVLPQQKLDEFHEWLKAEGVTVSGLRMGKQELSPASQIPKVDAKWQEIFGTAGPCILFRHSGETLPKDICTLKEANGAKCYRIIIAGPSYDGEIAASFMLTTSEWNGVNYFDTKWDGRIQSAIEMVRSDKWKETHIPKDDWLVVTVDYHS